MLRRTTVIAATVALASTVALAATTATHAVAAPASDDDSFGEVGIWYASWYSKVALPERTWLTGFGATSDEQFVDDVTGDGRADAVTVTDGNWGVAASTGEEFATPETWATDVGVQATQTFLADVDGDGRADAVAFYEHDNDGDGIAGDWYVARSTGDRFEDYALWRSGTGAASSARLLGDVTGDGAADLVAVSAANGEWTVAPSTHDAFDESTLWGSGVGTDMAEYLLGDVNGDGRADAAAYADGAWVVALSTGSGLGQEQPYTSGHGAGSDARFLIDGNGDGYAEPYAFFRGDVGLPTEDGQAGDWVAREYDRARRDLNGYDDLINSGIGTTATKVFMAAASGDLDHWKDVISFDGQADGGTWELQRYRQADSVSWDTWAGFPGKLPIAYQPRTDGAYRQYDSGDAAAINEHLAMLADAQIDYLLLDETNNLNNVSGAILNRATRISREVNGWNDDPGHRRLGYAFAIGGIQWTDNPVTIENEARQVWDEFANDPELKGAYHRLDGKPLLVVYTNKSNQAKWHSYTGDKSASDHFTVRFASSDPHATAGEYGWNLPDTGTVADAQVMVVMPGWNNHINGYTPVSRDRGQYYADRNWEKLLGQDVLPASVVINSFNEYAEDTAVQPADTSGLDETSEKWYDSNGQLDPDMYWRMTMDYVRQYKEAVPPLWASSAVYGAGDRVRYQGGTYLASWYSHNQRPGDPYGPWQELAMTADGSTDWTASRIFQAGDEVSYDGLKYRAKWYTRNQVPGDPNGPWKLISARYTFDAGEQGWQAGENVVEVSSVTSLANAPGHCVSGGCLQASGAVVAAVTLRSVHLGFSQSVDMSAASTFSLDFNTYGAPAASGYEVVVTLTSAGGNLTRSFIVQADSWTTLSLDLAGWTGASQVSRIDVGSRALNTPNSPWEGKFQLDNVDWR